MWSVKWSVVRGQRVISPCSSRWQWAAVDWKNQRRCPSSDRAPRQADPSGSWCLTRTRQEFNTPSFTASFSNFYRLKFWKILNAFGQILLMWIKQREEEKPFQGDFYFLEVPSVTLAECTSNPKFFTGLRQKIWQWCLFQISAPEHLKKGLDVFFMLSCQQL